MLGFDEVKKKTESRANDEQKIHNLKSQIQICLLLCKCHHDQNIAKLCMNDKMTVLKYEL